MPSPFSDRFEPDASDDVLARVASVGPDREHWLPERLLLRAWVIGRAYELPVLTAFEYGRDAHLNAEQAGRLAEGVAFVAGVTNDPLLGPHLQAVYDVAVESGRRGGGLAVEWP